MLLKQKVYYYSFEFIGWHLNCLVNDITAVFVKTKLLEIRNNDVLNLFFDFSVRILKKLRNYVISKLWEAKILGYFHNFIKNRSYLICLGYWDHLLNNSTPKGTLNKFLDLASNSFLNPFGNFLFTKLYDFLNYMISIPINYEFSHLRFYVVEKLRKLLFVVLENLQCFLNDPTAVIVKT